MPVAHAADWTSVVQVFLLVTAAAFFPAVLVLMTGFLRIITVLGFVRTGLGLQGAPPALAVTLLAVALTWYVMAPVVQEIRDEAWVPLQQGRIGTAEAADRAMKPLRAFMLRHTEEENIALFLRMASLPNPHSPEEVPTEVLLPAFAVSELQRAFEMGLKILLPFVAIDIAVSAALLSLGMMMLPPPLVALPLKILVFMAAGGWELVAMSLVKSFR